MISVTNSQLLREVIVLTPNESDTKSVVICTSIETGWQEITRALTAQSPQQERHVSEIENPREEQPKLVDTVCPK